MFAKTVDTKNLLKCHYRIGFLGSQRPSWRFMRVPYELGMAHFIWHLHYRQFLLCFADGANFRNGIIDTGWNVFDQMAFGFAVSDGPRGNATLIVGG